MILFIDDEPFFVDAYEQALRSEGYDVSMQRRVSTAMEIFERDKSAIDLVITDIMMPSRGALPKGNSLEPDLTTGFALFDWIRERSATIPIVVLTNKTTPDVDDKFESDERCWVFRKGPSCPPFQLAQQIAEILG